MERKNQIIQLWRCCFEDSEDFIHRFFSQVYQDQNAWTLEKDGRIVCAMQLLPYTINYCLLYTSPSPRDLSTSRMPSSA